MWSKHEFRHRYLVTAAFLPACLSQPAKPGDNFGGTLIGRKDRIEHLRNDTIIDNKHHALDQRHTRCLKGGKLQRARERQSGVRQNRKRQMEALRGLALIVSILRRKPEDA